MKKIKVALSLLDQATISVIGFAIVIALAKTHAISGLALYNKIMIIATFFMMANNSASITLLNSFGGNKTVNISERDVVTTSFSISLSLSIIGIVAPLFFFPIKEGIWVSTFLFLLSIRDYSRKLAFYFDKTKEIILSTTIVTLIFCGCTIAYLNGNITSETYIFSSLIGSCATYLSIFPFKMLSEGKVILNKTTLNFSGWQFLSSLLLWGGINYYLIVANSNLDETENAAVRAIFTLGSAIGMLILSMESFLPKYINQNRDNNKKVWSLLVTIAAFSLVISVSFHRLIVTTLLGDSISVYSNCIILVVTWQSLSLISYLIQIQLRSSNSTNRITLAYLTFLITSFFIAPPLVKYFGVKGVFIGILVSQSIYTASLCCLLIYRRSKKK